jgi:sugar/nucleoside kinase (ribokinase family)
LKVGAFDAGSTANRKHTMQNLSPRHVKNEEALRLGVASGWYAVKVSGPFVSGPHDSEADSLRRIAEIDPQPVKIKK